MFINIQYIRTFHYKQIFTSYLQHLSLLMNESIVGSWAEFLVISVCHKEKKHFECFAVVACAIET